MESPAFNGFHHILRIHLPAEVMEERITDVIDYCRRTGCQEVLLFTTSYDQAPSFAPLPEIERYAQKLEAAAERLRAAGIVVSVNVLQTLGHIYFPKAMQAEFPFQRRVHTDGEVSLAGACPLCEKLRDWVSAEYTVYARLRPRVLLVDDDFRTVMQGVSCFCDRHLEDVSARIGRKVSREEVAASVYDGTQYPSPLRRAWWESTTEGYVGISERIREAIHAVSPETQIGVMTAGWPTGSVGLDWRRILPALCGKNRPIVRPQINMYSEAYLREVPDTFLNPDTLRASFPDNVEYWPEIENYQYGDYAKSASLTVAEMATQLLQGFDHLALNVMDMYGGPFADHERLISLLEKRRPFLDAIHRLVGEGTRPHGLRISFHPPEERFRHFFGMSRLRASLPNIGLPVAHSGPSPWNFLVGTDVVALNDTEIDEVLRSGVLLELSAAEELARRGFSGRIGVEVGEKIGIDDLGYEEFSSPEFNPLFSPRCFPLRALVAEGDWKKLHDLSGQGIAASTIRNYKRAQIGPAVLLTENAQGERFGVLAWSGGGFRHLVENRMRAEQLRQAIGWIARRPLPVAVSPLNAYVWPILNRSREGHHVLGLTNLATDPYSSIHLYWGGETAPRKISAVQPDGSLAEVHFHCEQDAAILLSLDFFLPPANVAVLVIED